jgi:hypothetical protein
MQEFRRRGFKDLRIPFPYKIFVRNYPPEKEENFNLLGFSQI